MGRKSLRKRKEHKVKPGPSPHASAPAGLVLPKPVPMPGPGACGGIDTGCLTCRAVHVANRLAAEGMLPGSVVDAVPVIQAALLETEEARHER